MNRTLARLLGWTAGYLAVTLLERVAYSAGVAEQLSELDLMRAAYPADDEGLADVAPPVLAVVVADVTSSCVCCRSGAAVPPEGATR